MWPFPSTGRDRRGGRGLRDTPGHIVFWVSANVGKRIVPISRILAEEHGFETTIVCGTRRERQVYAPMGGSISRAIDLYTLFQDYLGRQVPPRAELFERAQRLEQRFDIRMVDIIAADRHLGRGFVKGANYPRSALSQKATYERSVFLVSQFLEFFEALYRQLTPAAVVSGAGSAPSKASAVVCRYLGVQQRSLNSSRFEDWYYWASDEYLTMPGLRDSYDSLQGKNLKEDSATGQSKGSRLVSIKYRSYGNLGNTLVRLRRIWVNAAKTSLGSRRRPGSYYLWDTTRTVLRTWREFRTLGQRPFTPLEQLRGRDFVFFPLHIEPESSMTVLAPESGTQQGCVDALARSLPAGWLVVVKEHPVGVGIRPRGFYDRLAAYPNVVLVHPDLSATGLVQLARAVGTITGSVGFEAAVAGVPVLSFGRHNLYNLLDHVFTVRSWEELARAIKHIQAFGPEAAHRAGRDGTRFKAAVKKCSFRLNMPDVSIGKSTEPGTFEEARLLVNTLLDSLPDSRAAAAAVKV